MAVLDSAIDRTRQDHRVSWRAVRLAVPWIFRGHAYCRGCRRVLGSGEVLAAVRGTHKHSAMSYD